MQRLTPMLHVPDVDRSIAWYRSIGFTVLGAGEDDGRTVWAELAFGDGRVMFSAGARRREPARRDVDLYLHVDDVAACCHAVRACVPLHEDLHDTFYGMREFIVRDPDGFWLTFGESSATARR